MHSLRIFEKRPYPIHRILKRLSVPDILLLRENEPVCSETPTKEEMLLLRHPTRIRQNERGRQARFSDAIQTPESESEAGVGVYESDIVLYLLGLSIKDAISCKIAVIPGENAGILRLRAGEVVTYGLSSQDTITLSSSGETQLVLAVQREIVDVRGRRVERQELTLRQHTELSMWQIMSLTGVFLVLGLDPQTIDQEVGFVHKSLGRV